MTSTEAIPTQDEVATLARTYVTLRQELNERGEMLKKLIKDDRVVVGCGGAFYSLTKSYATSVELPIRVEPVTLLTSSD